MACQVLHVTHGIAEVGAETNTQRMARKSPTPGAPDVGARIVQARKLQDISREDLAARIRTATKGTTSTNTLGRWETTGRLTIGELRLVACLLEIDISDLLFDDPRREAENAEMYAELISAAQRMFSPRSSDRDRQLAEEEFDLAVEWLHLTGAEAAQIVEPILREAESVADEADEEQDDGQGEDDAPPSRSD